jgi:hypothetical protein
MYTRDFSMSGHVFVGLLRVVRIGVLVGRLWNVSDSVTCGELVKRHVIKFGNGLRGILAGDLVKLEGIVAASAVVWAHIAELTVLITRTTNPSEHP